MICPTCKTPCFFICPSCLENVNSEWHKTDEAKRFGDSIKKERCPNGEGARLESA